MFFPKQHQEFFLNQSQASKKLGLGIDAGDLQEAYDSWVLKKPSPQTFEERVIFGNSLLKKSVFKSHQGEPAAGTSLLSQDVSQPSLGILLGGDSLRIFAKKRTTSE